MGQLFLVDLTVDPVSCEQVNVTLPSSLPEPVDKESIRKLATQIIDELQKSNESVRNFIQR